MKVTMLGVGNGFSPGIYDNNALIEVEGDQMLIDCGTTAWHSLQKLGGKREDVSAIFLTHLHFDHSGGVESAALYGAHITGKKVRLIVPEPLKEDVWARMLCAGLENKLTNKRCLEDYFQVDAPKEGEPFLLCGSVQASWFRTQHVPGKFSCGLLIDEKLLYTSDMVCDLPLLEDMAARGAQVILHDCQLEGAEVHADFGQLCTFPPEIRERIFLMHHGLSENDPRPDAREMHFLFQHKVMEI